MAIASANWQRTELLHVCVIHNEYNNRVTARKSHHRFQVIIVKENFSHGEIAEVS